MMNDEATGMHGTAEIAGAAELVGAAVVVGTAEIVDEFGPFPDVRQVHGLTFDGHRLWLAVGESMRAMNPSNGTIERTLDIRAHAGTAFDGRHLYQIADDRIQKIDPAEGRVITTIPVPSGGACSGLAWAEGSLWIAQYRERKIHEIDPRSGAIRRTITSNRFVTGITWVDGELWHGTWEDDRSDLRRIDAETGAVRERLEMPVGVGVSGVESDGGDRFFCGGGPSGKVRVVRRPARSASRSLLPSASGSSSRSGGVDATARQGPPHG